MTADQTIPDSRPAPAPGPPAVAEGCPTPLDWQQVLAAFREQRDEFRLSTSWGELEWWEYGQGPPLLLLGGEAGDPELLALLAYLLRDHFRLLMCRLPDAPTSVAATSRLPGWAWLVQEALRARSIDACAAFATGWGGRVALQLASDQPGLLTRLLLQGAVGAKSWTWSERLAFRCASRWSRPLGRMPGWNRVAEANHRSWFPPFDSGRWAFLHSNLAATPTRSFVQRQQAELPAATLGRLADSSLPILLVRTEGEGATTTQANEELLARFRDVRVESLHSAGLFPYLTHPHRLAKPLREFLAAAGTGGALESGQDPEQVPQAQTAPAAY